MGDNGAFQVYFTSTFVSECPNRTFFRTAAPSPHTWAGEATIPSAGKRESTMREGPGMEKWSIKLNFPCSKQKGQGRFLEVSVSVVPVM